MTHLLLALAQAAEPYLRPDRPASYSQVFQSTGFVGPLLVLAGLVALAVALRRWRELAPERLAPLALQRALEDALRGGDFGRALSAAAASPSVLGALAADGLVLHRGGLDEMLSGIERASGREALRLGNRVALLARLGGVVLLFALFGATTALMSMLAAIGMLEDPTVADFADGIGPALACVALGLAVALFCYVAFFALDSALTRRTLAVRDAAEELVRDATERAHRAPPAL